MLPVNVELPPALAAQIADALARHAALPVIPGLRVPDRVRRMTTGSIDSRDLRQLVRYYSVIRPAAERDLAALRTEHDSPDVRSWMLHGDYAGEAWAMREYRRLVAQRLLRPDPTLALFQLPPDKVYERFALGAWRYEFGLSPLSALRFAEDYSRATGQTFDVYRAFGPDAPLIAGAERSRRLRRDPFHAAQRRVLRGLRESVEERYGGAARARGIWYHGTAQRNLASGMGG